MKCPYRLNELHTCHDGKTYIYKEFAECYKVSCPYYQVESKGAFCRKIVNETGYCKYNKE